MDKLAWSAPDDHGSIEAEGPDGKWRIRSSAGHAQASFNPNLPSIDARPAAANDEKAKDRWLTEWKALGTHPGKADHTEAYQKRCHMFGIGNDDVVRAETVEEAVMLVDALRAGDAVLPRAEDQLRAAGFAIKHPDSATLKGLWSRRIRSGSLDISIKDEAGQRSVWVTYHGDGAQSWHNLAHVTEFTTGVNGTVIHNTLPDATRDLPRVVVAHALAVMEARLARDGRFSRPIGAPILDIRTRLRRERKASERKARKAA